MKLDEFAPIINKHIIWSFDYSGKQEFFSCGFMNNKSFRKHVKNISFPHARILYLLRGGGAYTDHLGNHLVLQPGNMIYRAADTVHSLEKNDSKEWLEFFIVFPNYISESFLKSKIIGQQENYFRPGFSAQIFSMIKHFFELSDFSTPLSQGEAIIKAQEIFLYLLKSSHYSSTVNTKEMSMVKKAEFHLGETLEKRVSMKDIAKEIGLGYESFRKIFKKKNGLSPQYYRINKRIEKAQALLLNHELNINEIGEILGYQDTSAFVKQFKKLSACTPKQFRYQNMS